MRNDPGTIRPAGPRRRLRQAFTMVEMLVVMGVVIALLGILVVGVGSAAKTAQKTNTRALMNTIKQAMEQFRTDIGYLPPVLAGPVNQGAPDPDPLRGLRDPSGPDGFWDGGPDDVLPQGPGGQLNPAYVVNRQEWYSYTSFAEFLLGYGSREADGYGDNDLNNWPAEQPLLGIRHPGPDGVWGATIYGAADGFLADRMKGPSGGNLNVASITGKVYGPYLQLRDPDLLASTDGVTEPDGRLHLLYPGDVGFLPDSPKVIVDYWGKPIRYYRKLYSPGSLTSPYRTFGAVPQPTLSDVFALRPFVIKAGTAIDGLLDLSEASYAPEGDSSTTAALNSAEYGLLSTGPDGLWNPFIRYDAPDDEGNVPIVGGSPTSFANEDNIVELGP